LFLNTFINDTDYGYSSQNKNRLTIYLFHTLWVVYNNCDAHHTCRKWIIHKLHTNDESFKEYGNYKNFRMGHVIVSILRVFRMTTSCGFCAWYTYSNVYITVLRRYLFVTFNNFYTHSFQSLIVRHTTKPIHAHVVDIIVYGRDGQLVGQCLEN
jgi:hypothetical protein